MTSLVSRILLQYPYTDCGIAGVTDSQFRRERGHASVFVCPKCGRRFIAHRDKHGKIVYAKSRSTRITSYPKE